MEAITIAPICVALGTYPQTTALKAAASLPNGAAVTWPEVKPIHRAFAPMARSQAYDIAEMAIATAVQAVAYGKPILVLPAVVASRPQHRCLFRLARRDELAPEALRGKRIGVRAYTQTTGLWIRAILADTHGIAATDVTWVTQEGAHVAEYDDPPQVERVGAEVSLLDLLDEGRIDAAIMGNDLPTDPRFAPVIADPAKAAAAWQARHGIVQINHLVVVAGAFAAARPDDVRAAYAALRDAAAAVTAGQAPNPLPFGIAAVTPGLDYVLATARDQGLLPRALTAAEVLAPAAGLLGDLA